MLKRKLAALLAGAMVLTSLPMVSFAATDNRITKVPQVTDDEYKFNEPLKAPALVITEKEAGEFNTNQTIWLKLENAEWLGDNGVAVPPSVTGTVTAEVYYDTQMSNIIADALKLDSKTMQLELKNTASKDVFQIPILAKTTDAGDVKVTIDPRDSAVSGGTYTFAVASGGETITVINSVKNIGDEGEIDTIKIDETKIGALGDDPQYIKLKLPSNFEWVDNTARATFAGGINISPLTSTSGISGFGSRELVITFDPNDNRTERGTIVLTGLKVKASSNAKFGEVDVKVTGTKATEETLVVAEYCDYGIKVEAKGEPKELYAGAWEAITVDTAPMQEDVFKLQTLVIEETIENSWLAERRTRIEFPSWVKIVDYKIEDDTENFVDASGNNVTDPINKSMVSDLATNGDNGTRGDNFVEFTSKVKDGKKAKLEVTFFVSVEANKTGDITALVSGRGLLDEYEVVLGKAKAPVTVEVEPVDVKLGIQKQTIGDIVITEAEAGILKQNKDVKVTLEDGFKWDTKPSIEVEEGDIEIKNIETDGDTLTFTIKSDSREASTLRITGGDVTLDRNLPEGEFEVSIGGDAILENNGSKYDEDDGKFRTDYVTTVVFANVTTPAPDELAVVDVTKSTAAFTIGAADFTVDGEVVTADVAPYIKDGRTMVSVKYVAQGLGVDASNILYDDATKTVTVMDGDRIVQMVIGSKAMTVNGAVITMDAAAEVQNGRTFVPMSWLAKGLGVNVSWDDATKTATFN